MPLDAVTLSGVVHELNQTLIGSRVDKIHQPERDEIIMVIRAFGCTKRLLLSSNQSSPRMHFINETRENPAAPPMFCMLMRKHLAGARIASITQPKMERVIIIEFDATDEMGVACKKYLSHEIMAHQTNVILYDEEMRIIDAVRRFEGDIDAKRQILPGLFYRLPPVQEKINPCDVSKQGLLAAILNENSELPIHKWIISTFLGFSPLLCREIATKTAGNKDALMSELSQEMRYKLCDVFLSLVNNMTENKLKPYMLINSQDNTVFDFTITPLIQYGDTIISEKYDDFSSMLELFYAKKERINRIKRRATDISKTIQNARDRAKRKLAMQSQELLKTAERDKYKRNGDIITANLYQISTGMTKATLIDYYDPECGTVEVQLKPELTAQKNAERYYKLYNKAKTAEKMLTEQIEIGSADIEYLESVLSAIERAETETDLNEIRQELTQTGYLSPVRGTKGKKQKKISNAPIEYRTRDGFTIFAGKNNLQNDLLTFKVAYKSDMWFHVQKIHGSHVILVCEGKKPTLDALNDACMIAAFHANGKGLVKIPVDYTEIRNIKKPPAAKPGMVIYHVYNTAYITPDESYVESLKVK